MSKLTIYDSSDFQEVENIDDIKIFYRLLYKLNESTLLMSQATSMSELYRIAVVTATTLLDIDRIGILLLNEQQNFTHGTWGIDEQGQLCNEYDQKSPIDSEVQDVIKLLDNQEKVCIWDQRPLYEFNESGDDSNIVGFGWSGAIALWENSKFIGWIACDNLINQRPFKTYQSHILRLLGSIISEYRLRFLAEDKNKQLNKNLEHKVQQLQETISTLETTKEHLNNVQSHNAMKDLIVGIAHEINTPLGTAILASSHSPSLLQDLYSAIKDNDEKEIKNVMSLVLQSVNIVNSSLQTTASLMTEFKRLSTIEVESIPAEEVCLESWLNKVINLIYSFEPDLKNLNINLNVPSPSPIMLIQSEVLSLIIKELLFNAFLHAKRTKAVEATISLNVVNNTLQLTIEDNGLGITPAMQEKIFNPFITTGRAIGRKGLGLNVVMNLVTFLLKGKLQYFDSDLGGAGFLITSPIQTIKKSMIKQL